MSKVNPEVNKDATHCRWNLLGDFDRGFNEKARLAMSRCACALIVRKLQSSKHDCTDTVPLNQSTWHY